MVRAGRNDTLPLSVRMGSPMTEAATRAATRPRYEIVSGHSGHRRRSDPNASGTGHGSKVIAMEIRRRGNRAVIVLLAVTGTSLFGGQGLPAQEPKVRATFPAVKA